MIPVREIFWNVGSNALTQPAMYALFVAAVALFLFGVLRRTRLYRRGQSLRRNDQPGLRRKRFYLQVLLQHAVRNNTPSGWSHALLFWSMGVLLAGALLIAIQTRITLPLFDFTIIQGSFSQFFSLALDLAGGLALIALSVLLLQRRLRRTPGPKTATTNALVHSLLYAILISGFLLEGCRLAATRGQTGNDLWEPLGLALSLSFHSWDATWLRLMHTGLWWLHLVLAMAFIALIPWTRLRHMLAAGAGWYVSDLGPKGLISSPDLLNLPESDDASEVVYGAESPVQCNWKDLLDTDACIQCERCQEICPACLAGTPLSPMKLITQLGEAAAADPQASLFSRIPEEAVWSCTTCHACQDVCPAAVEHLPKLLQLRRSLVLMQGKFSGLEVQKAMERTEIKGNPFGMSSSSRADWAVSEQVPFLNAFGPNAVASYDFLFFTGCHGSYDPNLIRVTQSFIRLCRSAGMRPAVLGNEERCCGEPMRKTGNEYLFQLLAQDNIRAIEHYGVRTIVTCCPHCFQTLRTDYRELGLQAEVFHYTQFLEKLLVSGALVLQPKTFSCTYHDSCYLGRYNNLYTAPRRLISAAGGSLVEMAEHHTGSLCCGAGGGGILSGMESVTRIAQMRLRMAQQTREELLLTSCPFCTSHFTQAMRSKEQNNPLIIKDLLEILEERLPPKQR